MQKGNPMDEKFFQNKFKKTEIIAYNADIQ